MNKIDDRIKILLPSQLLGEDKYETRIPQYNIQKNYETFDNKRN